MMIESMNALLNHVLGAEAAALVDAPSNFKILNNSRVSNTLVKHSSPVNEADCT
jgi:hypothetical protein